MGEKIEWSRSRWDCRAKKGALSRPFELSYTSSGEQLVDPVDEVENGGQRPWRIQQ
jgi:hypothetical protein